MKKLCFTFIFTLQYLMLVAQTGTITVTQVAQRTDGTGMIDVYFNLSGPSSVYYISIEASLNSGTTYLPVPPLNVTGNVGPISPGAGKHIIWNATQSNPNSYSTQTKLKVIASTTAPILPCGSPITINHIAGNVAPVNKTVTYGTVTNIPGEPTKCWITSNLGADHQAMSVDDPSEASAGWYWQFNRKQGYKHDGTYLTPSAQWFSIEENSDWLAENDPCSLELGNGWRLPTQFEWSNIDSIGNWFTWLGPWESGLKLHTAGNTYDGQLYGRGSVGNIIWSTGLYWSSEQDIYPQIDCANMLYFHAPYYLSDLPSACYPTQTAKENGLPIRCVRD